MAKKLSAFEKKFASERAKGAKTFMFNGKSYNTKTKAGGSKKSPSLPKTTSVTPTARPAGPKSDNSRPSFSGLSGVGKAKKAFKPEVMKSATNKAFSKMKDMETLSNFRQKESRRAADEGSNKGLKKKIGKFMLGKAYKG